ncbi:nucleoside-diphosphate sugar epimerase [Shewanella colwelliana]|uniref:nucleoside-diphosphate sugar epimerase n=1 Tax=Shewanella colwelliana TaxID=23 RepID=UPI0022AFFC39|nr:nucleoside-diphosphate sugar epimerase [Shewanella colwelliana]MCZ4336370.1 nucleoside-diphosphate sugar epimerase [Shewanella colwelliana]
MNAAIIGATGLVGQHLLQKLIDCGRYRHIWVLGRTPPALTHPSLVFTAIKLNQLPLLTPPFAIDHSFCTLGTTIKQAGCQAAFVAVDQRAVIDFVTLCDAKYSAVVTALGADANSKVFYNRVKGETEVALLQWAHDSQKQLQCFQPSLLLGQRNHSRLAEDIGQTVLPLLAPFMFGKWAKYRPIHAVQVAEAIVHFSANIHTDSTSNATTIDNAAMLALANANTCTPTQ